MKTELIGKKIVIIASKNISLVGKTGNVVDETKNTISVEMNGSVKKIIKDQCVFDVEGKTIEGKEITRSLEERIKR